MAYTNLDRTKPDGSSQAGSAFSGSANANDKALSDSIVMGLMAGGDLTITVGTGTAAQPQFLIWKQGSNWLRVTPTWGAGAGTDGNWTSAVYELSINSGTDYTTAPGGAIGTVTNSFDASGNLTGTSGGGPSGVLTWVMSLMGKWKKLRSDYDTHAAATGTAVHGLGSMSTQAASAIAVTGGTINSASVGVTTPAEGKFTRATEQFNTYTPGAGAGVTVDWAKGGSVLTNNGTNTLTFSNVPSGVLGSHWIDCSNFNNTTFPGAVSWGVSGKPSIAGRAIAQMVTSDGGTSVQATVYWRAV
jgi:hypothetical protein